MSVACIVRRTSLSPRSYRPPGVEVYSNAKLQTACSAKQAISGTGHAATNRSTAL